MSTCSGTTSRLLFFLSDTSLVGGKSPLSKFTHSFNIYKKIRTNASKKQTKASQSSLSDTSKTHQISRGRLRYRSMWHKLGLLGLLGLLVLFRLLGLLVF